MNPTPNDTFEVPESRRPHEYWATRFAPPRDPHKMRRNVDRRSRRRPKISTLDGVTTRCLTRSISASQQPSGPLPPSGQHGPLPGGSTAGLEGLALLVNGGRLATRWRRIGPGGFEAHRTTAEYQLADEANEPALAPPGLDADAGYRNASDAARHEVGDRPREFFLCPPGSTAPRGWRRVSSDTFDTSDEFWTGWH